MTISVEAWSSWVPEEELSEKPKLPFFKNVMKRRMSQLSRMVAQVGHDIDEMSSAEVSDIVFVSNRGEIGRQLDITNRLLEDGEVSPSAFGYSVFNAPAALLSLIEKKKGTARAICGGEDSFLQGLIQSILQLSSGRAERILFIYAEEYIPEIYSEISVASRGPRVLGLLLASDTGSRDSLFEITLKTESCQPDLSYGFDKLLQWLQKNIKPENNKEKRIGSLSLTSKGCSLTVKEHVQNG